MKLKGLCIITLTPFNDEGKVDRESLRNLIEFYIQAGVHGLTIHGIMGEAHKLTEYERDLVMDIVYEQTNDRVPIVVGCTADGLDVAKTLSKKAEQAGAHSVMIAAPRNLNNDDMLFKYYAHLSDAISIPIVVQDEPVTTGVKMSPALLGKMANQIDKVQYVKLEEAPTTVKTTQILAHTDQLDVLGGLGGVYFYEELARGATGIMTGFAFPEVIVQTFDLFSKNKKEEARAYFYKYLPLIRFEAQLGIGGVTIRKETFKLRGIINSSHVRFPGAKVDQKTMKELLDIINFMELSLT